MSGQLGLDCKLFYNTGTYGVPVWVELDSAREATLNMERGEADASRRSSAGWKEYLATLRDASIDAEFIYISGDADQTAIRDAFLNDTTLDVAAMDQDIATSGAEGLRILCKVMSCGRPEPLEDVVVMPASFKPTPNADSVPE